MKKCWFLRLSLFHQLCVVLSRVTSKKELKILIADKERKVKKQTMNVMFKEIFFLTKKNVQRDILKLEELEVLPKSTSFYGKFIVSCYLIKLFFCIFKFHIITKFCMVGILLIVDANKLWLKNVVTYLNSTLPFFVLTYFLSILISNSITHSKLIID